MRRVLLLGSGLTSAPLVSYLTRGGDVTVTVASNLLSQADHLAHTYPNTTARGLDVEAKEDLSSLIKEHELVISHVPFAYHPLVAKQCLAHNKNMVTSSYVSPAMQELHQSAVDKGLIIVNEVGLDPGIDHMLAMECFDEVHSKDGQITSFESWCGGLPHPQNSDNPLKYKFSWSPGGVLLAAKNSAKFIRNNKLVEIAGGKIMDKENLVDFGPEESPLPDVAFEGYYNRDSTKYVSLYNIPEAETVLRGTYRYKGCCKIVRSLLDLGLLNTEQHERLQPGAEKMTWKELLGCLVIEDGRHSNVLDAVHSDSEVTEALERLNLLSSEPIEPCGSPLLTLCSHLEQLLKYEEGEQDAIFLHHFIRIKWPDNKKETRHINLTVYGTSGVPGRFTAMAQAVGLPLAITAKLVLSGKLNKTGVVIPTSKEIYEPILENLKSEGIAAAKTTH